MSKSVEVLFNEALEQLQAKVSPAKFTEVSKSIAGFENCPTIAAKLTVVKAVLANVKESTPITKHNGASENCSEGSPLNEGRSQVITEDNNTRKINLTKTEL